MCRIANKYGEPHGAVCWMDHTQRTNYALIVSNEKCWVEEMVIMSQYISGSDNSVVKCNDGVPNGLWTRVKESPNASVGALNASKGEASDWILTNALVLCPTWRGPGLYLSILLQTPSISLQLEWSFCFHMVLEAGLLGPCMVLEGHLLVVLTCWQNDLSALKDVPLAGEALKRSCQPGSWHLGWAIHAYAGRDVLFSSEVVVLEGFSFVPSLFSQDHSVPAVVVVLEEGLVLSPVMVLECSFPDLAFLWRIMFCKTLNISFPSISLLEEVLVLKGLCWRWAAFSLCLAAPLGAWCLAGPMVLTLLRLHVSLVSAHFMFSSSILHPIVGLMWAWVVGSAHSVPSPVVLKGETCPEPPPCSADQSTASCQKYYWQHFKHLPSTGILGMRGTLCSTFQWAHSYFTMTLIQPPSCISQIENYMH